MTKLSELISKPVISLFNCEYVGYITNALFDKEKKTLKYLIIYDDVNDIEYVVETKHIVNFSNDAISIRNNELLELKQSLDLKLLSYENIIFKNTYSTTGQSYGFVKDVLINENYKITELVLNNDELLLTKNIIKIGKIIICGDKKISLSRYKLKPQILKNENYAVTIQSTKPKLPIKATINEDLLLNRTVYNTIYDSQNNAIIKANTIVNNSVINIAKKYGKLKELTRYSF